jgi:uncharacterized membrane protein HdeD (DUF308 family)
MPEADPAEIMSLDSYLDKENTVGAFAHSSRARLALRGVLALIAGSVLMVWPDITIVTTAVLFAIYLFMDAASRIVIPTSHDASPGGRLWRFLVALLDVVAAGTALAWPGLTAAVLVVVIGAWALITGFSEISLAFGAAQHRAWLAFSGALTIVVGILLIALPGIGAVTIAWLIGAYLAVYGISLVLSAIEARSPFSTRA